MSVVKEQSRNKLERSLGIGTLLAIAVSVISPTTSVFITYGSMLQMVGTGVALAFLIGGILTIINSFIFAELSTAFPLAGGAYVVISRVFGKPYGIIMAFLFLLMGLGSVPTLALGTAGYMNILFPQISTTVFVIIVIIIATLLAMARIHSVSWVTAAMVVLEFLAIITVTVLTFAHAIHPISLAISDLSISPKGLGSPLGVGVLFAALPVTLFAFSGYEFSQNFSEETINVRRVLSRTIIISAVIGVTVETLAVLALTLATKNFQTVMGAAMPAYEIVLQSLGSTFATILLVGVVIATLDCTIAVNIGYIRVFYSAARDGLFTEKISNWLAELSSSNHVPARVALVWGIMVMSVSLIGTLNSALAFTGSTLVLVYALVSLAALFARKKFSEGFAYKMPFWPLPPILLLIPSIYVLTQQALQNLITIGIVVIIVALYYALVLRRRLQQRKMIEADEGVITETL